MCDGNIILNRFKMLIDSSGVSRQAIADSIGCDTSTITKHYNGDRNISTEYVIKYAQYFNVSTDYLLGLTAAPTTDKDVRYICDYTGLSEKSVNVLHLFYTEYNSISHGINILLESEATSKTEAESRNCLKAAQKIENYLTLKKPKNDKRLSISRNGNIINLSSTQIEYTSQLTLEDVISVKTIAQSELAEKVLLDNVIDVLKQLKKELNTP